MNKKLDARRHTLVAVLVALSALVLSFGAAPAGASDEIEAVWSFEGGTVDIQAQAGGTFLGIVSTPTKFATCTHSVGEDMWTQISRQPDGSYWGLHQWLYETTCAANPTLGPTAWRVLHNSAGGRFLRVCFSSPESGQQPKIAPDGSSTGVTHPPCVDSKPIAPLPTGESKTSPAATEKALGLPPSSACVRRRSMKIKLHAIRYDPFKQVVVWVGHRKVLGVHNIKKLKKGIAIKNLPEGSYTVRVLAITILGHRLSGGRRYNSCTRSSGQIGLHTGKHRHHGHGGRHKKS